MGEEESYETCAVFEIIPNHGNSALYSVFTIL